MKSKIFKKLRWLYPGIKVKRWIFMCVAGMLLMVLGAAKFVIDSSPATKILDSLLILLGIILIFAGTNRILHSFLSIFLPSQRGDLVDIVYRKRYLERGPKVVAIGGGHGLFALLKGLKEYTSNLIAIVTVADTGGSSGRLRQEFDMLPPGDIRSCLVALADAPALMGELFQFRFKEDSDLKGHNFGNLLITAMTQLTGDFEKAVEESSKVLAIRGRVIPSTLNKVNLVAEYADGSFLEGEADIPERHSPIKRVYLKSTAGESEERKKIKPTPEAIKAIREADLVVIGPGSLYTSILPNLVIKEITQAIVESAALKLYICNVMTQYGETDGYSASAHLRVLIEHTHPKIVDYCLVNTRRPDDELLFKYSQENSFPTAADTKEIEEFGCKVIKGDLISASDFVRHDSNKLTKIIIDTLHKETVRRQVGL